ncbi:hypothetical protein JCM19046_2572 [Bacillus sp. JCM 19046]|nr:hypothetical protein JCM19045_733 [Bacillus sp. JCM 19045]GAF18029.1 hypothetical protein JCM19046_2572 [Bacillus sp. JCM 19046]
MFIVFFRDGDVKQGMGKDMPKAIRFERMSVSRFHFLDGPATFLLAKKTKHKADLPFR